MSISFPCIDHPKESQRLEELDQILLLRRRELQLAVTVVMIHHVIQRREPAVVVEAAFGPYEETAERSRAIAIVGRAAGLEVVDPELLGGVHRPPGLDE